MYKLPDGNIVSGAIETVIDGVQYNRILFTQPETLKELGVLKMVEVGTPSASWTDVDDAEAGICTRTYDEAALPTLDEVKDAMLARVRLNAGSLLSPTDWMVVRNVETGVDIPQDVLDRRAAVRTHSNDLEAAIAAIENMGDTYELNIEEGWPDAVA